MASGPGHGSSVGRVRGMGRDVSKWPTLSGPHKDGGRHVGIRVLPDARAQLTSRGFLVANKMLRSSVDVAAVRSVRIGDVFDVRFDGARAWWVWSGETKLGRLTWSLATFEPREWRGAGPRIDEGTMQVIRLGLDAHNTVINAGGIVRPVGEVIPPVREAVPYAEVYTPTLGATISGTTVTSFAENVPGAPRVGRPATNMEALPRRTLWERLRGR